MKTDNKFIAAQCDQAGEVCSLVPLASKPASTGNWILWNGEYEKQSYDVWVKGCDVVLGCWPNAGKMVAVDGSGRQWLPEQVLAVRVSEFQGQFPRPPKS